MGWLFPPAHAQAESAAQAAAAASKAADTLISQGGIYGSIAVIVGLACLAGYIMLGLVIRSLWGTIQGRDVIIASLQEKRAAEAVVAQKAISEVSITSANAISANTGAQAEMANRMQGFADLVRPLSDEHKRMLTNLDRNADKIDDLARTVGSGCRA